MSLNLIGCSSEPLFAILLVGFPELDLFSLFFEFREASGELVAFIGEFPHLAEENDVGQVESAVFVVIRKVCLCVGVVHCLGITDC